MTRSRFLLPVVASATAVAVGVGAFFIALPFAQPTALQPAFEPATALQPVSPVTDLEAAGADAAATNLEQTTAVTTADRGSPESFGAAMDARLRELDAISVTSEPDGAPVAPSDRLLVRDRATLSELGVDIADPCTFLDAETAAERECPRGASGTVLGGDFVPELTLTANWGSHCFPSAPQATSHSFNIYSSEPVTLTVSYIVSGAAREITIFTSDSAKAAWESDATPGWITHCATLLDLPAGWSDNVIIRGVTELGARAEIRNILNLRGPSEVPPSWVEPLSDSGVMMSIATKDVSTVRFAAFVVPFGQAPAACDFDDLDGMTLPFAQQQAGMLPAERESGRYNPLYVERHTAGFIVPEASTISFCAGWVDSHSWVGNVPDHVFSEVLHSPDLSIPTVTVDSFSIDPAATDRPERDIRLDFSMGDVGSSLCGQWWTNSDPDSVVCDYAQGAALTPSWGLPLVVRAETTAFGSTGKRFYTLPVAPIRCGVGCEPRETEYFDIGLESRDPCLGNGCAASRAGTVRLRVDWNDGHDSWADSWIRDGEASLMGAAPVFDRNAVVTLGEASADGLSQDVELRVDTDRPASVVIRVEGVLWSTGFSREVSDSAFELTRVITLDTMPTGGDFAMTLEVTGEDGVTNVYSANPERGRSWAGGTFSTSLIAVDIDATVEITRADGGALTVGNFVFETAGTTWSALERGDRRFECGVGPAVIDLGTPVSTLGMKRFSGWYLELEAFTPRDSRGLPSDCGTQAFWGRELGSAPTVRARANFTVDQLRSGVVQVYNDGEYIVTVRLSGTTGS